MTIALGTPVIIKHPGNDSTKVFDIPFPTYELETLAVYLITSEETPDVDDEGNFIIPLVNNVDFLIENVNIFNAPASLYTIFNEQPWMDEDTEAIATGYTLVIRFISTAIQSSRFRSLGDLAPINLEVSMDRLAMHHNALRRKFELLEEAFTELKEEVEESGSVLPPGGATGALLGKASPTDRDVTWLPFAYAGYSTRYDQEVNFANLQEFLDFHIAITYAPPSVVLSASGNVLREKGTPVTATTLSANVTKRSEDITRIAFYQGATLLEEILPPAVNPGSGVTTYNWAGSFSDNTTFSVQVTDASSNTVSSSTTFNFVYPYYYGTGVPALSPAEVASLTKQVINSNANLTRTFNALDGQVFYFAYPASYGDLTSILDQNGFETINSWTRRTQNITGLDGSPVSYAIYEFNNVQVAGEATFTFRR